MMAGEQDWTDDQKQAEFEAWADEAEHIPTYPVRSAYMAGWSAALAARATDRSPELEAEVARLRAENANLCDLLSDAVEAHTPDELRTRAWAALAAPAERRGEGRLTPVARTPGGSGGRRNGIIDAVNPRAC